MSEQLYTPNREARIISEFTLKLMQGKVSREEANAIQETLKNAQAADFIAGVDLLVQQQPVSLEMKKGINKLLNLFYAHLNELPQPEVDKNTFAGALISDNEAILRETRKLKPFIKELQKTSPPSEPLTAFRQQIEILTKVEKHYQITENILFPFLEKLWPAHRCLQVLWSVHDDVREELRELEVITKPENWDLKRFNRLTGDLFFNISTAIFREEKILIPATVDAGVASDLNLLLNEAAEIGWSFIEPPATKKRTKKTEEGATQPQEIRFATGSLSPEQIELIFNHLPLDITFVDENDRVLYFSTPPKRTFTRTNAVIGRTVQNCHPPESVWMVEKILAAFKNGEKDVASFWIPFKNQFVYIQYYAVRDKGGNYRGTLEVTQDVKEIRELKGERRLLNWDDE
jgi:DUF438 domain-containing protein